MSTASRLARAARAHYPTSRHLRREWLRIKLTQNLEPKVRMGEPTPAQESVLAPRIRPWAGVND